MWEPEVGHRWLAMAEMLQTSEYSMPPGVESAAFLPQALTQMTVWVLGDILITLYLSLYIRHCV